MPLERSLETPKWRWLSLFASQLLLLDAADLALEMNETNLLALRSLLNSPELGLRYWGIVGCFLLNDRQSALKCLKDDSHEVRAMAGWLITI